jgi:SCP-2 sterol transfer family
VPRFLSPEWIEACNDAFGCVVLPDPGPDAGLSIDEGRFVIVEEVRGSPDGDLRITLAVADGTLHLTRAPFGDGHDEGPKPDVTVALDYGDAAAMAKGELAIADALTAGRIRVRGDLSVLAAGQAMLEAARAATGDLHASTSY